ncbi:MAG: AAA family ATPase [Sphingomicrobium sp.]
MIPATLPADIRADPKRSAEVQVYDRLRGDPVLVGFTVFYSCEWIGEHEGLLKDGEADFVLAHPAIGYLVIEVKGGRVNRRIADGKWTTTDRKDETHPISNPVAQAKKSKKVILDALRKTWPGGRPPFLWARHGVVFPHSYRPRNAAAFGAAMPPELVACKEEMPKLGAYLFQMLAWAQEGTSELPGGFGSVGVSLLEDFYGRDLDFSPRLSTAIDESEAELLKLTATQVRYLDFLAAAPTALIEGGAGTGKTTLAVERARRAAAAGRSVVLMCFNHPLAVHLSSELSDTAASVTTFHGFCGRMCSVVGVDVDSMRAGCDERTFWAERLPSVLADIGLDDPPETYDDLIVDEGQDFRGEWVDALRLFIRPRGSLFVFRDDFQNLYGGAELSSVLGVPPMPLCENVRNTRRIFEVGNRFRQGPPQRCLGPSGEDVRWVTATRERLGRAVERELNRLIDTEGVAPEQVAVLTGCAVEASPFSTKAIGRHPCTTADEPTANHLVLDSVMRFKGLDRPVVILCAMGNAADELAYVGLTRARSLLVVVDDEKTLARLGQFEA